MLRDNTTLTRVVATWPSASAQAMLFSNAVTLSTTEKHAAQYLNVQGIEKVFCDDYALARVVSLYYMCLARRGVPSEICNAIRCLVGQYRFVLCEERWSHFLSLLGTYILHSLRSTVTSLIQVVRCDGESRLSRNILRRACVRHRDEGVTECRLSTRPSLVLFCTDACMRDNEPCYDPERETESKRDHCGGIFKWLYLELDAWLNSDIKYFLAICSDLPLDHGTRCEVDRPLKELLYNNNGCICGLKCTQLNCKDVGLDPICVRLCTREIARELSSH